MNKLEFDRNQMNSEQNPQSMYKERKKIKYM